MSIPMYTVWNQKENTLKGGVSLLWPIVLALVLTSYQAPWTTEYFWLVQVTYSPIMHLISTAPDNAHYIRVLRSSRKSPITHTQHLLFLPLLTGWFSFFSSQLQCHFYRETFLPPTPTRKGVTNMVFLCLDFSAGHSQFAPISPIHPWEAESLILDHQDSPCSQFLLGPTDDRQRQKLGCREKTEAGHVLHAPFCWVSVLGGGSSSGGPNCSCLAWAHLVSTSIIPATFSVPFTGSANPASIQAAFSLNSLRLN